MQSERLLWKRSIFWTMAAARALLGPVMIAGSRCGWSGGALAVIVSAALLSDIFDGVLARRWHCDTAGVRLFDSMADTVFYVGCAVALWIRSAQLVRQFASLLAVVAGLEMLRMSLDLIKFGKPASYHSYLAKSWGLLLASALVLGFACGPDRMLTEAFWWAALLLGVTCQMEGLSMSLLLPEWTRDVKTLRRAWKLRQEMLPSNPRVPPQRGGSDMRPGRATIALVALLLIGTMSAAAATISSAGFVGGSPSGVTAGAVGTLDASPDRLTFYADSASGLEIPFTQVQHFQYREELTHHLGLLPAIAVGLVSARMHRRLLTISYLDDARTKQIVVFELPRDGARVLLPLLRERTSVCLQKVQPSCGAYVR